MAKRSLLGRFGRRATRFGRRIRRFPANALARVLLAWYRNDAAYVPPRFSANPSDNIQIPLNLVMPLEDRSAMGRARLLQALMPAAQEMQSGLNNTGFVHFGRVMIVQGSLCIFTVYDGDLTNYIREFVSNVGGAFNTMMEFVEDAPPLPVEHHPDEFVEWVMRHDALQLPEVPTDLDADLVKLPRALAQTMNRNDNVQLLLFHSYPGFSTAEIRAGLGIGW